MPTPSPLRQLADQALDGELAPRLTEWRAAGRSWKWIAREIWSITDRKIDITDVTAQSWARQLGVEATEQVS